MNKKDETIKVMTNKIQLINRHIDTFQKKIEMLPKDISSELKLTINDLEKNV